MKPCIVYSSLILALNMALPGLAATGADTYKTRCAMCHAQDGSGATPVGQQMKVRDLRSTEVQKQTDGVLVGIVTNGRKAMPPFGKSLSTEQIKDVVSYMRSLAK